MNILRPLILLSFLSLCISWLPVSANTDPSSSIATVYDAAWDTQFILQAVNGPVYAIVRDASGTLYIGGDFTAAGKVRVQNLAKWDGTSWSAVGSGVSGGTHPMVLSLAIGKDGELYVGGEFTKAGDKNAPNIAKWQAGLWFSLNVGTNGPVKALTIGENGALYAGGGFTTAGGTAVRNIAMWNNGNWSSVGTGIQGSGSATVSVNALATKGSTIYAGGEFSIAGGHTIYDLAAWDGTDWSALASGLASNSIVYALATKDANLYVAGAITTTGSVSVNNIARWNGSTWSAIGTGALFNNAIYALCVRNTGEIVAGGSFTSTSTATINHIAQWNGTQWTSLGKGIDNSVFAIAEDAGGSLYAGGNFAIAGDQVANNLAQWKNGAWSLLGSDVNATINGTVYAMVTSGTMLYVAGNFNVAGTTTADNIARWDGTSWSAMGRGMNAPVRALSVSSNGDIYAGGEFTMADGTTANYIARWNSTRWIPLGAGVNGPVYALAREGINMYIGGNFTMAGSTTASRIVQWDGAQFIRMNAGMNAAVNAIATYDGEVYIAGEFSIGESKIARWRAGQWQALLDSINGPVYALAFAPNGSLYVGGEFLSASPTVPAQYIVLWDGKSWKPVGTGTDDVVRALAVSGQGKVTAGGDFSRAGNSNARYIASWYEGVWSPLGTGLDNPVRSLLQTNDLFVGGDFALAGDIPSHRIARWINCSSLTVTASGTLTFCAGDSVVLDAGSGYRAYLWNTGTTTQTLTVKKSGSYLITVTGDHCSSTSLPVDVTVKPIPLAHTSGDTSICMGSSVQIVGTGGVHYLWSPSMGLSCTDCSSPLASPPVTTTYMLKVTDQVGCSAIDSIQITVYATPAVPTITQNGTILSTDDAKKYQWFFNGTPIPGATGKSYTPSKTGNYTVQVTNEKGCATFSASFPFTVSAVQEENAEGVLLLHPNPASETLMLDIPGMARVYSVEIINALGIRVVYMPDTDIRTVDVHALPTGVYLVRVRMRGQVWVQNFIKQ